MSFYRTLLAAVAAVAIATPVFAEDNAAQPAQQNEAAPAVQLSDNSSAATPAAADQAGVATSENVKVNMNKATVKELMKVKGVNASKAKAIVAYRKKHGDFKSVDELANVKGFKKMKAEKMKEVADQLAVE